MMANLFDERPMWTRIAISYRTKLDDLLIKQVSVFLNKILFFAGRFCKNMLFISSLAHGEGFGVNSAMIHVLRPNPDSIKH